MCKAAPYPTLTLTMNAALLTTGCLLYVVLGYINCIETYWKEMISLRNYQPVTDSEFESTEVFSLFSCMSHCSMTDGCNYISYVANTSLCLRHHTFVGFTYKLSSSIWSMLKNDGCPEGWYSFKSSCYLFPEEKLMWIDSIIYCRSLKAHLAELDTGPKNVFIKSVVGSRPELFRKTWIGGSDIVEEGKWVWNATGSPMMNYTNWCGQQPNDQAGKLLDAADCACFLKSGDFECWHDCSCEREGYPLCETQI